MQNEYILLGLVRPLLSDGSGLAGRWPERSAELAAGLLGSRLGPTPYFERSLENRHEKVKNTPKIK